MSEPFLAEIKIFGFNFAPRGWAFCDGQILPINQNQSLFSLLGTTYGGDGRTSFALPELRGRVPIHTGNAGGANRLLGQRSGEEGHVLSVAEMPQHSHTVGASNSTSPNRENLDDAVWSASASNAYTNAAHNMSLHTKSVSNVGGGQGHPNMQPYLALSFCIALQGLFPSRN